MKSERLMDNKLYRGIYLVQIMLLIDASFTIMKIDSSQAVSLLRYAMYFFGTVSMYKGIRNSHQRIGFIQYCFLIWVFFLLVSAVPELLNPIQNYVNFKSFISGKLFIYSLPFLMCADLDTSFFRKLFRLSYGMALCYLAIAIPAYIMEIGFMSKGLSEYISFLLEGSIILLMTLPYQNRKKIVKVLLAVVIVIILMMLLARRNKVVFYGGGLIFALGLNILKGHLSYNYKNMIILGSLIALLGLYNSGGIFNDFFNKMDTGMYSREFVIEDFFTDFNRTPSDWIYGRGLFGEFDAGVLNTNVNTGLRDGIENGYLQLILKGGWIWLGLLILISIISIYKGFFKSNNIFVKGCACIILLYYLDMIGFGVPTGSLKYIMVFLSISVCMSRKWRSYTDDELKYKLTI